MSALPVRPVARIVADDPRADGGSRQIMIAETSIAIDRRVAGVQMRLSLPIAAYRGVLLTLCEGSRGPFYRLCLDHADPDLRVVLAESEGESEMATQWKAWALFFSLPRLTQDASGFTRVLDSRCGALGVGAMQPRRRGWPLKQRRSRMSARRLAGPKGRVQAVYRGEREIVCYE
jgi:hypothetical protein